MARIVYKDPTVFLPHLPRKSVFHCSKMWTCRRKVTVDYLQHIVEQKNGKESVPILWKFLQKVRLSRCDHAPTCPWCQEPPAIRECQLKEEVFIRSA